eukprot:Hpha_TRINITY_DN33843_c0_g1::TRINITY_DN33843_c0_g1_i1::g.27517::m.27517
MAEAVPTERRYRPPSAAQYVHKFVPPPGSQQSPGLGAQTPSPFQTPPIHLRPYRHHVRSAGSASCLLGAAGAVCLFSLVCAGVAAGWAMARTQPAAVERRRPWKQEWAAVVQTLAKETNRSTLMHADTCQPVAREIG